MAPIVLPEFAMKVCASRALTLSTMDWKQGWIAAGPPAQPVPTALVASQMPIVRVEPAIRVMPADSA